MPQHSQSNKIFSFVLAVSSFYYVSVNFNRIPSFCFVDLFIVEFAYVLMEIFHMHLLRVANLIDVVDSFVFTMQKATHKTGDPMILGIIITKKQSLTNRNTPINFILIITLKIAF